MKPELHIKVNLSVRHFIVGTDDDFMAAQSCDQGTAGL